MNQPVDSIAELTQLVYAKQRALWEERACVLLLVKQKQQAERLAQLRKVERVRECQLPGLDWKQCEE